jgi:hypothetical protein
VGTPLKIARMPTANRDVIHTAGFECVVFYGTPWWLIRRSTTRPTPATPAAGSRACNAPVEEKEVFAGVCIDQATGVQGVVVAMMTWLFCCVWFVVFLKLVSTACDSGKKKQGVTTTGHLLSYSWRMRSKKSYRIESAVHNNFSTLFKSRG